MRTSRPKIIPCALCAAPLLWLSAAPALGHGEEEILLFVSMADEPNLLRVSTALVGGLILALGALILRQTRAGAGEEAGAPRLKRMAPGLVAAGLGAAILLTAAFILPERIPVFHDHPVPGDAGGGRRDAPRPSPQ